MDVLAHCRVYPLSNFYHPSPQSITLPNTLISNTDNDKPHIGLLHLIEHDFKMSNFKKQLFNHLTTSNASYLIIDITSTWKRFLLSSSSASASLMYMNSTSILSFEGLINYLVQLNDHPTTALQRSLSINNEPLQLTLPLSGIIIDNLSYLPQDPPQFKILTNILKLLRKSLGCWIMTTSYGLEYNQGIENTISTSASNSNTYIPLNYTKEMDIVLLHERDLRSRIL